MNEILDYASLVVRAGLPIVAAVTLLIAVGRFSIIKPNDLISHGKSIGLILISGGSLISVFQDAPAYWSPRTAQLYMVQYGLFFYSVSWFRAVKLYREEQIDADEVGATSQRPDTSSDEAR